MIKVIGIEDVVNDFKRMDRETRRASTKSVRAGTNKLKNAIKDAAPVDRGDIKKAIKAQVKTYDRGQTASGAVIVDVDGRHWIPVEFGHSNGIDGKPVPPHPFVYPTRDRVLPGILNDLENDVLEVWK